MDTIEEVFEAVRGAAEATYAKTPPGTDIEPMGLVVTENPTDPEGKGDLHTVPIGVVLHGTSMEVDRALEVLIGQWAELPTTIGAGIVVPVWSVEGHGEAECQDLLAVAQEHDDLTRVPGVGEGVLFVFVTKDTVHAAVAPLARIEGESLIGAWSHHDDVHIPWAEAVHDAFARKSE